MNTCVICSKELTGGELNTKDKFELSGNSYICKSCSAKIGIKNIFSAGMYTAEKAKKKYYERYPDEQSMRKSMEDLDDEHILALMNDNKKSEAIDYIKSTAGMGVGAAYRYLEKLVPDKKLDEDEMPSDTITQKGKTLPKDKELYHLYGKGGEVAVYKDRIEISRPTKAVFVYGLAGTKSIPISSITSIQVRESGFLTTAGFIQFGVAGGIEAQGGINRAVEDENTVMIAGHAQTETALEIKKYLEKRIYEMHSGVGGGTTIVNQTSAADEIMKFKKLADDGVITQDEFETKKKQLLGL